MRRVESLSVQNDGVAIYCRRQGSGTSVLLIHGSNVDSGFFDGTADELARVFSVVTYDRRGHGRSADAADGDYSLDAQAEDAAAVIRELGGGTGGRCDVVAHSSGSNIAMALAVKYPSLVGSLLLYEPPTTDCLPADDECVAQLRGVEREIREGAYSLALVPCFALESLLDERSRPHSPEEVAHRERNCGKFVSEEFSHVYFSVPDYEGLKGLSITVGLGERSLDTYHARNCPELCRRVDGSLMYFPGGHNSPYDLPREFACMVAGHLLLRRGPAPIRGRG
jgi:pimeloyl-ACP methyl ester carboxylesterase